jgi:hypothetical protein
MRIKVLWIIKLYLGSHCNSFLMSSYSSSIFRTKSSNGLIAFCPTTGIAEPSESGIVYAHKGSMDYQIVSRGQAAHSSMPVVGQNAIKPLLDC